MVVLVASILLFLLDENTASCVPEGRERVEHLIDTLCEVREKIVIPNNVQAVPVLLVIWSVLIR